MAWLFFKVENDLKTEGSQAPFGLPTHFLEVLRAWEKDKTCSWVFPNSQHRPWKTGAPGFRPFDQLKELGKRAGVQGANWKRFFVRQNEVDEGKMGLRAGSLSAAPYPLLQCRLPFRWGEWPGHLLMTRGAVSDVYDGL